MVSYLPEIRAGMALLLAFCAMVQDLRNFKIGNRQILVGLLGAAGCMAYEWMMGGVCAEQLKAGFSVLGVSDWRYRSRGCKTPCRDRIYMGQTGLEDYGACIFNRIRHGACRDFKCKA